MKLLPVVLFILVFVFIVCLVLELICCIEKPVFEKAYCFVFEHKLWNGWKNVIKNFDKIVFVNHFSDENFPDVENYLFEIPYGETTVNIRYWVKTDEVSAHHYPDVSGGCLTSFDKYHSQMLRNMLIEKFDLK